MTDKTAERLAIEALANVRCRMQFAECWDEGVRNVTMAIQAAAREAEANALSFTPTATVEYGAMF